MVVSFMGIAFGYSESKEREGKELERIFEGGTIGDLGEERIPLAGVCIRWRFEGSECTLH
jgi:hypothetical protein